MVGRAEFFAAQKKHSQRVLPYNQKPEKRDDSLWFTQGLAAVALLADTTPNLWGKAEFAATMEIDEEEAERRLRLFSRQGITHMAVEKDAAGKFIRFTWSARDLKILREHRAKSE